MPESNLPTIYAALLEVSLSEREASAIYSFYLIAKERGLSEARTSVHFRYWIRFYSLLKKVGIDVNSLGPSALIHPFRPK